MNIKLMNNLSGKCYHKTKKVYNIGLRKLSKPFQRRKR